MRVWTKEEIRFAFDDYLMTTKLVESDAWRELSVDEQKTLKDYHFGIFYRELRRWRPKRRMSK